jgi:hypothetical protein
MVDNDANANDVRNDVDEDIVDIVLDLDRDLALNGTSTFTGTVPVRSNILRMVTHLDVGYNNMLANAAESLHHFESCLEDAEAAKKNQEAVLKRYVPNSIYQRNNFIKLTSNELHKEKNMSLRRMKTMLDTIREVQQKPVELLRTAQHADKSWFIHPPNPMALMMTMTKTCIGGLLIFIMLTVQLEDAITICLTVSLFSMFCVGWGVLLITEKEMAELKNQNNQVVQHVRESSLQREQQQYQLQKESIKITRELEQSVRESLQREHLQHQLQKESIKITRELEQQSRQRETVLEQQLVHELLQKQQRIQELEQQQRQELEKSVRELDQQHQQSRQREEVLEQQLLQQLLQQQQKGQESLQLIQELEQQEQERINNNMCSICLEHPRTQVCFPCGHTCTCQSCSLKLIELTRNNNLAECPICRGDVQQFMELFFS